MRKWARAVAPAVVLAVLLGGCSENVGGKSQPAKLTPLSSPPPRSSTSTTTTTASTTPTAAPAPGAPVGDVIAWIAAGKPADASAYQTVTREGTATHLHGEDVAFTTPSGKTQCMTSADFSDALMCLVQFNNPPPPPADIEGHWSADWVNYDGKSVSVGGIHGDPGPFGQGSGPSLPYGQTLKSGDYQCRIDEVGLYCANLAHQTAARFSDAGVEPFGCLTQTTPPRDIGLLFSC